MPSELLADVTKFESQNLYECKIDFIFRNRNSKIRNKIVYGFYRVIISSCPCPISLHNLHLTLQLLMPNLHKMFAHVRGNHAAGLLPRAGRYLKEIKIIRMFGQFVQHFLRRAAEGIVAPYFYGDEGGIADEYLICLRQYFLFQRQLPIKHIDLILPGAGFGKLCAIIAGKFGHPNGIIMLRQISRHGRFAG